VSLDFFAIAITIVEPMCRPDTTPLVDTVAIEESALFQVTDDPGSEDDSVNCCCSSRPTSTARCWSATRVNWRVGSAGPLDSQAIKPTTVAIVASVETSERIKKPSEKKSFGNPTSVARAAL
jgi:hypothetical protein